MQRHFEPFCFFLQTDRAQLAYQSRPIMRYLLGKSCRIFFVWVSHAEYTLSEDAQTVDTSPRHSFLQQLRDRTLM
jgi:hypothetical protein